MAGGPPSRSMGWAAVLVSGAAGVAASSVSLIVSAGAAAAVAEFEVGDANIGGRIECDGRVAAGSVVLSDVPSRRTVAGVPAREIGFAGCEEPALAMDQMFKGDDAASHD